MARRVIIRPQAEADAIETRDWYESRRSGLGREFNVAVEQTIERIVVHPLAHPRIHGETRRAVLDRFPYSVYFRLAGDDMVVRQFKVDSIRGGGSLGVEGTAALSRMAGNSWRQPYPTMRSHLVSEVA